MTLLTRLSRLERNRSEPLAASVVDIDLPPDLCARLAQAQTAGTFPRYLAAVDLEAIVAAADVAGGQK